MEHRPKAFAKPIGDRTLSRTKEIAEGEWVNKFAKCRLWSNGCWRVVIERYQCQLAKPRSHDKKP